MSYGGVSSILAVFAAVEPAIDEDIQAIPEIQPKNPLAKSFFPSGY